MKPSGIHHPHSINLIPLFLLLAGGCIQEPQRTGEHTAAFPPLAAAVCGDGTCELTKTEDCKTCPQDCGGPCTGCGLKAAGGCAACKCEACVCTLLPACCTKTGPWNQACANACKNQCGGCGITDAGLPTSDSSTGGSICGNKICETSKGEDCAACAADCGTCDGCQVKVGSGCPGCKCEACVCTLVPSCCASSGQWDSTCVTTCKTQCSGCGVTDGGGFPPGDGAPPPPGDGAPPPLSDGPPPPPPDVGGKPVCGNKTCETSKGEDCGSCSADCGKCDGCQLKVGSGCPGCKCEACVCKALPFCCSKTGMWGSSCVTACKTQCGGCGVTDGSVQPPLDGSPSDRMTADQSGGTDTGKTDTGKADQQKSPDRGSKDSATTTGDTDDTGCEISAAGSSPMAAWPLLLAIPWLCTRRRRR